MEVSRIQRANPFISSKNEFQLPSCVKVPWTVSKRQDCAGGEVSLLVEWQAHSLLTTAHRFVAFISGSFAAVLAIALLIDPELFLGFEITKDRTVLFYIGLFTTVAAVARGVIPVEMEVFDPAAELSWVMYHTRYNPPEWKGRLHSDEVTLTTNK